MLLTRTPTSLALGLPSGPIHIHSILAIGKNYAEHAREQGAAPPERPMVFTKNLASLALDGEDIIIPKVCQDRPQVDFEGELAFVIGADAQGRRAKDVPLDRALDFVLGYAVANDVSARWWQKEGAGGQFWRGKSFDTFCPLSTRLVPAAGIADPQSLRITTRLNGQVMQDASTNQMMFGVAYLVSELSCGTTLLPGTLVLTGTPSGVGFARTPPVFLKDGDAVEITIDRVGTLKNRVRFE